MSLARTFVQSISLCRCIFFSNLFLIIQATYLFVLKLIVLVIIE